MRRTFQALLVLLIGAVMIGGAVSPALASSNRTSGSLRWVFMSGSATGGKMMSVRVTLWDVAGAGGAAVQLTSSNPALPVPGQVTVPAGQSEVTIKVKTLAVTENTAAIVTARMGDRVRFARTVVLRPYLSSTTVQSRIRSGGLGKIIVRLSGIAPQGGVTVYLNSSRPGVLPVPTTIHFPAGKASVSINVPADMVSRDVPLNVTALYRGIKISKPTIVRKFKVTGTQEPAPTATEKATEAAADEPTATFTATPEASATAEIDETATQPSDDQTATAEADLTATQVSIDETATQTAIDETATQIADDATATQVAIDETATQIATDATSAASATAASDEATATQVAADQTATQVAGDATATQIVADATATQIAVDESAGAATICHSTGSGDYNALTLSLAGVFNGHLGSDNGAHGGVAEDIIPPFEFRGETHQQNWDDAGQAIYFNDCQEPIAPVENTETPADTAGPVGEQSESAPQSLSISVSTLSAPKGGTVWYTICLTQPTTTDVTISWYPAQAQFDAAVNSGSVTIPQSSVEGGLCSSVAFSGLNRGNGAPTGDGYLIFGLSDGQFFTGPQVRFEGKG